jgi:hypothetical protein
MRRDDLRSICLIGSGPIVIGQASCGPGPASGWNWAERARSAGNESPSTVPS